jgi:hypothetical protein
MLTVTTAKRILTRQNNKRVNSMLTDITGIDLRENHGIIDLRSSLKVNVDWEDGDAGGALVLEGIKGDYPSDDDYPYQYGVIALDQDDQLIEIFTDMDQTTLVADLYSGPRKESPLEGFQWYRWAIVPGVSELLATSKIHFTVDGGKTILCGMSRPLEGGGVEYKVGSGAGVLCRHCEEMKVRYQ